MTAQLRVERALRLLPSVEAMEPLRALLVSTPRADDQSRWSSSGPYLTIGKHSVDVDTLRQRVDDLLPRLTTHITTLYSAYLRALAASEQRDGSGTVAALADGGAAEERIHRIAQASAWYDLAFHVAAELAERGPEIEMLDRLGRTARARSRLDDAARYHQRALVLAEASFDHDATIQASICLGHVALARSELAGAHAWYLRALRQAETSGKTTWIGAIEHHLGEVEWRQGDASRAATRLKRARELLEPTGAHADLARVLCTIAQLEHSVGNVAESVSAAREALAWAERPGVDAAQKCDVLICVSGIYAVAGRLLDAEFELRRAESLAIEQKLGTQLIEIYVAMGRLCAQRDDETGFVFFEQGAELCHALVPESSLEGRVYEAYGNFRLHFDEQEEALAHLLRARQIYEAAGDSASLARLREELGRLSA